jgi:hypothetical protein
MTVECQMVGMWVLVWWPTSPANSTADATGQGLLYCLTSRYYLGSINWRTCG